MSRWIQYRSEIGKLLHGTTRDQLLSAVGRTDGPNQWVARSILQAQCVPPNFCVSRGLFSRLLATDLRGVTPGDVRPPHPFFSVELPEGCVMMRDCDGVIRDAHAILANAAIGEMPSGGLGIKMILHLVSAPGTLTDHCFHTSLHFSFSETLSESSFDASHAAGVVFGKQECGDGFRELIARCVLNLCFFMEAQPSSVRNAFSDEIRRIETGKHRKRRSAEERVRRLRSSGLFVVGTEIDVDRGIEDALSRGGHVGGTLGYRTLVRGHWRNQVCGPKNSLRRMTWVAPHIRGPGEGLAATHVYKVTP